MMQLRRLRDLKHYALLARDGEIGRIEQVYFDDAQWLVRYFVVHTGGWLLGRDVLIAPRSLAGMDEKNKCITLDLSREQVENAPPLEPLAASVSEPADPHLRDSGEVMGYHLQARDGELGHVHDLVLDDQDWGVRYFVVGTGNWWPGKKVLVAPIWVDRVSWADRAIFVDLERELIRAAPAYDPDQIIGHDDEVRLYAHYGKAMRATHTARGDA